MLRGACSHDRRPPAGTDAVVDFNFGAAPINSEPCVVSLYLENNGLVPAEWLATFIALRQCAFMFFRISKMNPFSFL